MIDINSLQVPTLEAGKAVPTMIPLSTYKSSMKVGDIVTAQQFDFSSMSFKPFKITLEQDGTLRVVSTSTAKSVYSSVALGSDTDTLQLSQDETNELIMQWLASTTNDGKGSTIAHNAYILVTRNNIQYKITAYLKQGITQEQAKRNTANIMVLTDSAYMDDTRILTTEQVTAAKAKIAKWRVDNKAVLDSNGNLKDGAKLVSAMPRMSIALPKRSNFTATIQVASGSGEIVK